MIKYISLLRGINVSGHRNIAAKGLLAIYESLGFTNVRTYLQSGNVIFNSHQQNANKLSIIIAEKIKHIYGFTVVVIVRTPVEIQCIIDKNPFVKDANIDVDKLHVTFLSSLPEKSKLKNLTRAQNDIDKFTINNKEVYLYCPNGYGRSKFSNNFFEKKLGLTATTRNWKTVKAISAMAEMRAT